MNSSNCFLRKWSLKKIKESKHFDSPSLSLPLPQGKLLSSGKYRNLSPQTNGKLCFIKVTGRKFNLFFILSKEIVISLLKYPLTSSQKWDDICRLSSLSTLVPVPTFGCGKRVIREKPTHPKLCPQKPFQCANEKSELLPRRLPSYKLSLNHVVLLVYAVHHRYTSGPIHVICYIQCTHPAADSEALKR